MSTNSDQPKTDGLEHVRDRRQHLDRWGRNRRTAVDEPLRQVIAHYQQTLDDLERLTKAESGRLDSAGPVLDQLRTWIADLDVVIAKRRGNGLGAEQKTFDLLDRQKLLRTVVRLLSPATERTVKS